MLELSVNYADFFVNTPSPEKKKVSILLSTIVCTETIEQPLEKQITKQKQKKKEEKEEMCVW